MILLGTQPLPRRVPLSTVGALAVLTVCALVGRERPDCRPPPAGCVTVRRHRGSEGPRPLSESSDTWW